MEARTSRMNFTAFQPKLFHDSMSVTRQNQGKA